MVQIFQWNIKVVQINDGFRCMIRVKKKKRGIQDLPEDGVCGMGL